MISNLDPSTQQFLDRLSQISERMQNAQRQISSGQRFTQVSDAPDSGSTLLALRASLSSAQQIQTNLGLVKIEVDSGEQALQHAVSLLDQVRTLGTQGTTDFATAAMRADLAQQAGAILQQMVGLAGTTVAGRYIFSGDADQQAPYTIDLTQTSPVSAYLGSGSTRVTQHPNGATFAVADTAQNIFDS